MSVPRLRSMMAASLCGLACVLAAGVAPGVASATQLGASQFGENGPGAGQLSEPLGIAVDNDSSSLLYGDVYIADTSNNRIDRFNAAGQFQLAWGWGVADGAEELQTCTTLCQHGRREEGPYNIGGVPFPEGVAVDSNPPLSSASSGDVYVESGFGARVEKFTPSGEFLLTFGGDVNEKTGENVCVAGEACQGGTPGSANGQFEFGTPGTIAVGPGGRVYVGDEARVQVFEPSGVWKETISLAGLSSTGLVTALAVDSSGDVFVSDSEAAGVREFEPDGAEKSVQFDPGSMSVTALAVDGSGDLFVGDSNGQLYNGFHVLKYSPAGVAVTNFGAKTVRGGTTDEVNGEVVQGGIFGYNGIAFSEVSGDLYATEHYSHVNEDTEAEPTLIYSSVWALTVPPPGPSVDSSSATPEPRGSVLLEGLVNPQNGETTYRFEYVDEADFVKSGYASASSTPSSTLEASLEDQPVRAQLTGLPPNTTYHYRIVATSSEGTATGPDQTVETLPSSFIGAEYATNVASTSATLDTSINPLGSATEYRLEYGPSASYGTTVSGSVGEGSGNVAISVHRQELQAGTTYHYRFVTVNPLGTVDGPDRTFTTQGAVGGQSLLDGRQWELVSPANKNGALIEPRGSGETMMQAAEDGGSITYLTIGALGSDVAGYTTAAQILSTRGPGGWSSQDLASPHVKPTEIAANDAEGELLEDRFFSLDLSLAAVEPVEGEGEETLSPQATEPTVYLRDNANGTYRPLVTAANVPPGTRFGFRERRVQFIDASPDLSHVILGSPEVLTENEGARQIEPTEENGANNRNLYEWADGKLRLVNILPDGKATEGEAVLGRRGLVLAHALSSDGRRVIWEHGTDELYMRDMATGVTVQLGGLNALFQTASTDGSKIFYNEIPPSNKGYNDVGSLWEYDANSGSHTDLSVPLNPGEAPGVQSGLMGASEDGSYLYFVATGVLAPGAKSGEDNLYVSRDTGVGWQTTLVATLSKEDESSWMREQNDSWSLNDVSSRVSPDGRYLAFMSNRSLTGYDNVDGVSAQRDEEVYLYDSQTGRLTCASCDPTGSRPVGLFDPASEDESLLVDRVGTWTARNGSGPHWLAGSLPGWAPGTQVESGYYQPRYLSDSGRLFFDSPIALVSQDTNGVEDVYEYEPTDVGDCSPSNTRFVANEEGCVDLLTSGTSSTESAFYDASVSGDDVFFVTAGKLTSEDYDSSSDLYDAHVCSTSSPCLTPAVSPPACATADSCKPAPSPQPTSFGAPASATFAGQGNVAPAVKPAVKSAKHKAKVKRRKGRKVKSKRAMKSVVKADSSVRAHRNGGAKRS